MALAIRRSPRFKQPPLLTLDAGAYSVIVQTLELSDISALSLSVGKQMSSFVLRAAERRIERALLDSNRAPLTILEET